MRIFKLSAVAAALLAASSAYATTITPLNWSTFIQGNASVSVSGSNDVSLYAKGISWSEATANLGSLSAGTITESFSYTTSSVAWWEDAQARYLTGTAPIYSSVWDQNNLHAYTSNSINIIPLAQEGFVHCIVQGDGTTDNGTCSETFSVDGNTSLIFSIYPNYWSFMGDHLGTTLSITDLNIDYQVAAVPEPETYALMLAGLGVVGFAARRRKQHI
jgi:PEP-CTERM motif